jgi:hypothetical protein
MLGNKRNQIFILFLMGVGYPKDKIGSLLIGVDYYTGKVSYNTSHENYAVENIGLSFGAQFPINISFVDVEYKVKVSTHQIESWPMFDQRFGSNQRDNSGYQTNNNTVEVSNAILIGKELPFRNHLSLLPQIGLGYQLSGLDRNDNFYLGGGVCNCWVTNLSSSFRYDMSTFGIGIMVDFQTFPIASLELYEFTKQISILILLFK